MDTGSGSNLFKSSDSLRCFRDTRRCTVVDFALKCGLTDILYSLKSFVPCKSGIARVPVWGWGGILTFSGEGLQREKF